jgi:hypothetical protein
VKVLVINIILQISFKPESSSSGHIVQCSKSILKQEEFDIVQKGSRIRVQDIGDWY